MPLIPEDNPVSEIVDEIVGEVEHEFTPRAGGMIDTWHKHKAAREAADREREQQQERVEEGAYKAVKVATLGPEVVNVNIVIVPAGGTGMVLPNSPYRARALLAVTTTGKTILLGKDSGQVLGGSGFPVIQGNNPIELRTRAQVWAFNSDVNPVAVSVLTETYAPESC